VLLGGGGTVTTTDAKKGHVALQQSFPSGATTWTAIGVVTSDTGGSGGTTADVGLTGTMTVTAYVICTT
jgi:hypothetical protein